MKTQKDGVIAKGMFFFIGAAFSLGLTMFGTSISETSSWINENLVKLSTDIGNKVDVDHFVFNGCIIFNS